MAKKKSKKKRRSTTSAKPTTRNENPRRFASIYPGSPRDDSLADQVELPEKLVTSVESLERQLAMPVWLLAQDGEEGDPWDDTHNMIGDTVATAFFSARRGPLKRGEKIALLIDSQGGKAKAAYELAMLLRHHCGGFVAVVPRHAKSAATLLALGADSIVLNDYAELGPLDVQIWDADREGWMSGLDEVQALERLQAFAMDAVDRMTLMLLQRTRKKAKNVLPMAMDFVAKMTHPMFEGIDVVRYTQMSRALKVAEEYGKRLLSGEYGEDQAARIASWLVEKFPEHGFPIYAEEARRIGLNLPQLPLDLRNTLEDIAEVLPNQNAVGKLV